MRIKLQHSRSEQNDGGGTFYFEIQSGGNYETITVSEIYLSKEAAMFAIDMFRHAGMEFEFIDETVRPS